MAAELVPEPERPLEVHPPADPPGVAVGADVGLGYRLGRDVDVEPRPLARRPAVDHRQADAVAGDRGAERDAGRRIPRADPRAQVAARLQPLDLADVADDSR